MPLFKSLSVRWQVRWTYLRVTVGRVVNPPDRARVSEVPPPLIAQRQFSSLRSVPFAPSTADEVKVSLIGMIHPLNVSTLPWVGRDDEWVIRDPFVPAVALPNVRLSSKWTEWSCGSKMT